MRLTFRLDSVDDYERFLAVRRLPKYRIVGRTAEFPDEYAHLLGVDFRAEKYSDYKPADWLFDYQKAIASIAVRKHKFAAFVDCGLGKTAIFLEFARHVAKETGRPVLIVSPSMVIAQTIGEHARFYPQDQPINRLDSRDINEWIATGGGIGICSYNIVEAVQSGGRLGGIVLDESSMLKSAYGKWGIDCVRIGSGVPFKMCCTGTPAPNDRIEFAQTAVFLDQCRTVNEFYARYFVNRGQTDNRWEMKPHAQGRFYSDLAGWSIFLSNPSVYGWKDNATTLPAIEVKMHDICLTGSQRDAQQSLTGSMFVTNAGGITVRSKLAQIAKGKGAESNKPQFIAELCRSFKDAAIVWCKFNDEQDTIASLLPDAGNISGATPDAERERIISDFKTGRIKVLISKPKILGFGLNLQVAKHQVFSTLMDSYEEYYQCIKRSNRVGSTKPLTVHIPITELDAPGIENVLRKASQVDADTRTQEALFKEMGWTYLTA